MSTSKSAPSTVQPPKQFGPGNAYLFLYNAVQTVGWSYLLYQVADFYISGDYKSKHLWDVIKITVSIFQNAAVLEILHVMLGLVKSSVSLTAMQVYSRVMVVCLVLWVVPEAQNSHCIAMAVTAWSITEIIRYSYYALNIIDAVPYALLWCRYTFFIFLYPIGVSGELLCIYSAMVYAKENHLYTLDLPNKYNISISYYLFLFVNILGYIPGFPPLYLYMVAQRKKIISGDGSSGKKKK